MRILAFGEWSPSRLGPPRYANLTESMTRISLEKTISAPDSRGKHSSTIPSSRGTDSFFTGMASVYRFLWLIRFSIVERMKDSFLKLWEGQTYCSQKRSNSKQNKVG